MVSTEVTNKDIKILHEFFENRGVEYILTGTCALFFHGILPEGEKAHDIDVIIPVTPETSGPIHAMLSEMETLSGIESWNDCYPDSAHVYRFKVGEPSVMVNAFKGDMLGKEPLEYRVLNIDGDEIKVHTVRGVLKAKFGLGRQKDHAFFHKLIVYLTKMFK